MKSMEELFHAQLQDVYFAEKQLLKALPRLAKNSTNEQLAQAFTHHLKETEGQVDRLEKIFKLIEKEPRGRTCNAILGIIAEGQEVIEEVDDDAAYCKRPQVGMGAGRLTKPAFEADGRAPRGPQLFASGSPPSLALRASRPDTGAAVRAPARDWPPGISVRSRELSRDWLPAIRAVSLGISSD
jgi:Domain of unknown function (DUF892)